MLLLNLLKLSSAALTLYESLNFSMVASEAMGIYRLWQREEEWCTKRKDV